MNKPSEHPKWLFLRPLRWVLITIVCLVTLVALFYAEEDFRGAAEWARTKQELEAKGEILDLDKLIPPPIPDDQNLAAAPIFADLFKSSPHQDRTDGGANGKMAGFYTINKIYNRYSRGSFLMGKPIDLQKLYADLSGNEGQVEEPAQQIPQILQAQSDLYDEVAQAAARPQTRWPIRYENGLGASFPELQAELLIANAFKIRAMAELNAGDANAAWQDCQVLLRLSSTEETSEVGCLVENSIHQVFLGVIWEGMWRHSWSDSQLRAIQASLAGYDAQKSLLKGIRVGRAGLISSFLNHESLAGARKEWQEAFAGDLERNFVQRFTIKFCPKGWLYLFLSQACQCSQDLIEASRSLSSSKPPDFSDALAHEGSGLISDPLYYLFFGSEQVRDSLLTSLRATVRTIDYSHLAYVACQIERFRQSNGHLPQTLEEMPELAGQSAALDILTNQPFTYHLIGTEDYRLYSFGPNRKDDGGVYVDRSKDLQGDWVWYSSPQAAK